MKYAKIINGVVDVIAYEQPVIRVTYQDVEIVEEPVRDEAGNPVLDDDGQPLVKQVEHPVEKTRLDPDPEYTQVSDDVFGGWRQLEDRSFEAPPAPPTFPTKAEAQAAMLAWIEELSDEITGKRPLAEKLSWPTKLMVAKDYLANPSGDVPAMISAEAALRGSTPVELAELIVAKGLAFAAAASAIAGLRAKTEAALDAVTDPYDHEVVLAAAMQEAVTLKAQLGL